MQTCPLGERATRFHSVVHVKRYFVLYPLGSFVCLSTGFKFRWRKGPSFTGALGLHGVTDQPAPRSPLVTSATSLWPYPRSGTLGHTGFQGSTADLATRTEHPAPGPVGRMAAA